MREIYTDVEVRATPERVWDVITDLDSFPDWNPFLRRAEGDLKAGGRLQIEVQSPPGKVSRMSATVVKSDRPSELRWSTRQALGLVNGEHVIVIRPEGERVRVIQRGVFSGLLSPLMGGSAEEMKHGLDAMNEALRARAERGAEGNGAEGRQRTDT